MIPRHLCFALILCSSLGAARDINRIELVNHQPFEVAQPLEISTKLKIADGKG